MTVIAFHDTLVNEPPYTTSVDATRYLRAAAVDRAARRYPDRARRPRRNRGDKVKRNWESIGYSFSSASAAESGYATAKPPANRLR
jgi:hypothetical protein